MKRRLAYIFIFLLLMGPFCSKNPATPPVDESEEVNYSIHTDKTVYQTADTIHWTAKLVNMTPDTIKFSGISPQFFEWYLIDSMGIIWDTFGILDSASAWMVPSGDSLILQWPSPINLDSGFRILPVGSYFGIMKPWFNYDSLAYDTAWFKIESQLSMQEQLFLQIAVIELRQDFPNWMNRITAAPYQLSRSTGVELRQEQIILRNKRY